jgi:hypothetical protein
VTTGNFDTVLHVHNGPTCIGGEIGCDDDGGSGTLSRLTGTWDAGTYWIVVDGYGTSAKGTGTLQATIAPAGPTCTLLEGFESGVWPASGWVSVGGGGSVSSAYAHDGAYGIRNPDWYYRTTTTVGYAGDVLYAWVRPSGATTGRAYIGFAASSGGCKSMVAGPNTGQLIVQDNSSWGYNEYNYAAVSFTANRWYKLEITFGSGNTVTGRLYDSDGVTLRATLAYTYASSVVGGIAIRAFDNVDIDTITLCR